MNHSIDTLTPQDIKQLSDGALAINFGIGYTKFSQVEDSASASFPHNLKLIYNELSERDREAGKTENHTAGEIIKRIDARNAQKENGKQKAEVAVGSMSDRN